MARSSLALALVAVVLVAFVHTAVAASTTRGDGGEETRTILVAIKQSNVQEAERLLNEEISNVQHPNYGRYLTLEQLAHLMAPAPASVAAVCDFLTQTLSASTCSLTHNKEFALGLHVPVSKVATKAQLLALVPASLRPHIDFVDFFDSRIPASKLEVEPEALSPRRSSPLLGLAAPRDFAPFVFGHRASSGILMNMFVVPRCVDGSWMTETDPSSPTRPSCISSTDGTRYSVGDIYVPRAAGAAPLIASGEWGCRLASQLLDEMLPLHQRLARRLLGNSLNTAYMCAISVRTFGLEPSSLKLAARTSFYKPDLPDVVFSQLGSMHGAIESLDDALVPVLALAEPLNTPNHQKSIYGVSSSLQGTNATNRQMVWGTGTYGYSEADLSMFYKNYDVAGNVSNVRMLGYAGVPNGANWGEATLDVQYISSIGLGVATVVANTDNATSSESSGGFGPGFLEFAVALANDPSPPYVVSLSLGSLAYDACDLMCRQAAAMGAASYSACTTYVQAQFQVCMYDSQIQQDRINTELMKAGLRGVTIVAAAGDGGNHFSFGAFSPLNPLGRVLNEISCNYTLPTFPASSPYVIGVGGVQMVTNSSSGTQYPIGCSAQTGGGITGGCGFSWVYAQPSYQAAQVASYLKSVSFGNFNASGRAYPDVSGIASGVPTIMALKQVIVGGTSASTPEVGGLISLINDHRLNNNLPPLGFLNPRLYQAAAQRSDLFVDVTSGSSRCGTDKCCNTGFEAQAGWDAFTGFGNPLFPGWLSAFGVAP